MSKNETPGVRIEERIIMKKGTTLMSDQLKEIMAAGFVHVTGLRATGPAGTDHSYIIGEKLDPQDFGKYDHNNGVAVIVTVGGHVWIGSEKAKRPDICPNGKGVFVPCSKGEKVRMDQLLARLLDPYAGIVFED